VEEHREVEKAVVLAREEVAAAVVAKDKATPVDGQARPATLQVEVGRTQGNPSELDPLWRHLVRRNGAGWGNNHPLGTEKGG